MKQMVLLFAGAFVLAVSASAGADENRPVHHHHMTMATEDSRQAVSFPPMMRTHILFNMRNHLQALSEILTAMASGNYTEASHIANQQLGLDSQGAAGCKAPARSGAGATPADAASMDEMMATFMPSGMRSRGLAMHQAASEFGVEAEKAAKSGDGAAAYRALARVTQQCVACHSAYRLE